MLALLRLYISLLRKDLWSLVKVAHGIVCEGFLKKLTMDMILPYVMLLIVLLLLLNLVCSMHTQRIVSMKT